MWASYSINFFHISCLLSTILNYVLEFVLHEEMFDDSSTKKNKVNVLNILCCAYDYQKCMLCKTLPPCPSWCRCKHIHHYEGLLERDTHERQPWWVDGVTHLHGTTLLCHFSSIIYHSHQSTSCRCSNKP